jgi:hypothetical protein
MGMMCACRVDLAISQQQSSVLPVSRAGADGKRNFRRHRYLRGSAATMPGQRPAQIGCDLRARSTKTLRQAPRKYSAGGAGCGGRRLLGAYAQ